MTYRAALAVATAALCGFPGLAAATPAAAVTAPSAATPAAALAAPAAAIPASAGPVAAMFPGCASEGSPVVVGNVSCELIKSRMIGGTTAFSYFVPPACAGRRCPSLYLLHGFGGDYTEMLGTAADPSGWVAALDAAPAGTAWKQDPWEHYDPKGWVPQPALPIVLIAPDGRTVQGGYGPAPDLDGYWTDWNPRYARGGDAQTYDTPPPRFGSYLDDELVPFVEQHFPVGSGRAWRALGGTSLGGYGAFLNALQHPDMWSSVTSVSGAMNFLFAPALQPPPIPSIVGVAPPVALPHVAVPSLTEHVPTAAVPAAARSFLTAIVALGDPVSDQAFFRGNMPTDLAFNGRAYASGGAQSLYIQSFVNDMVARRPQDVSATPFEVIVFPMNVDMQSAFAASGVANTFAIHQGVHSDVYRNAWLRGLEVALYARVRHLGGGGTPTPTPAVFDYRTISSAFSIWGWDVAVKRPDIEFLTMRSVSCSGLSLQGSGVVTVTVPRSCGTGVGGHSRFVVDLGPSMPVDDPAGLGAVSAYGRTVMIHLTSVQSGRHPRP